MKRKLSQFNLKSKIYGNLLETKIKQAAKANKLRTMQDVQEIIKIRQQQLKSKLLFQALSGSADIEDLQAIAPHFYFFVLSFQDMLRLTHQLISDSDLKKVALNLAREDAGHEQWYFLDVRYLNCERDVAWLFGSAHQPIRDMVYSLMSHLLCASDDKVRIIFPLIIESTGTILFEYIVNHVQQAGYDDSLKYFASSHQKSELNHSIYDDSATILQNLKFEENIYLEIINLINNVFDYFDSFADHLEYHRTSVLSKK